MDAIDKPKTPCSLYPTVMRMIIVRLPKHVLINVKKPPFMIALICPNIIPKAFTMILKPRIQPGINR
jgi:hypothetical protein